MPSIRAIGENEQSGRISAMELWRKQIELSKLERNMRQGDFSGANEASKLSNEIENNKNDNNIRTGKAECATCASRTYVDKSNDSSVSFQTPTHVPAAQSFSAVAGHEAEHVRNENTKAVAEKREVVSSSVTISYAICPECGASYASGGLTRTVTKDAADGGIGYMNEETQENGIYGKFDISV